MIVKQPILNNSKLKICWYYLIDSDVIISIVASKGKLTESGWISRKISEKT